MKTLQNTWMATVSWASTIVAKTSETIGNLTLADWAYIVSIVSGVFFCVQVIHNWNRKSK